MAELWPFVGNTSKMTKNFVAKPEKGQSGQQSSIFLNLMTPEARGGDFDPSRRHLMGQRQAPPQKKVKNRSRKMQMSKS